MALRLTLFQTTGQRMLLSPSHLQRDVDPSTLVSTGLETQQGREGWVGKRTGVIVPSLASSVQINGLNTKMAHADVTDFLLSKVLTPEKLRKPDQMVQVQKNIAKCGELLYITRPLIYGNL